MNNFECKILYLFKRHGLVLHNILKPFAMSLRSNLVYNVTKCCTKRSFVLFELFIVETFSGNIISKIFSGTMRTFLITCSHRHFVFSLIVWLYGKDKWLLSYLWHISHLYCVLIFQTFHYVAECYHQDYIFAQGF